mgnify:CR=1 FL=1
MPARRLALVASELSCPSLLVYLSAALQMSSTRRDIGAVVLLQPPNLNGLTLNSAAGRRAVLQPYAQLYQSSAIDLPDAYEAENHPYSGMYHSQKQNQYENQNPIQQNHNKTKTYQMYQRLLCSDFRDRVDTTQGSDEIGPLLARGGRGKEEEKKKKDRDKDQVALALREEAKLRAEIEMLEWQSSAEYKGAAAKRRRNLSSKKAKLDKILYNKEIVSPLALPLTEEDLCGASPPLSRARAIGASMRNRMLVVCTAEQGLGMPLPMTAMTAVSVLDPAYSALFSERFSESESERETEDGGSLFEAFDLAAQGEAWGRQSCQEAAGMYRNEPVISLQGLLDDDEKEEIEEEGFYLRSVADYDLGCEDEGEGEENEEFDTVWCDATRKRHAKLAAVVEQWLRMLSSERFRYL